METAISLKDWNRCVYCGRFISYGEFETKMADVYFTPDTHFTVEKSEPYHIVCELRNDVLKRDKLI